MNIMHIALGGCLRAPPVHYGRTPDTGGHIAYVLGASLHQADLPGVGRVDIVTRAFEGYGPDYAKPVEQVSPGVTVIRLRSQTGGYLSKEGLWCELASIEQSLVRHIDKNGRPDVLHAHFADAAEIALKVGQRFGIPVVYTPHSLALQKAERDGAEPRRLAAEKDAIGQAAAIIVSSRDEAERQICDYDPSAIGRVHKIRPGLPDPARDQSVVAALDLLGSDLTDPKRPVVLAIARPVAKKNLLGLIEAFATNSTLRNLANLVILAGQHDSCAEDSAVLEKLIAARDRLGLRGIMSLPVRHTREQAWSLYKLAASSKGVFVNPAFFEPFGLTLLEAAAAGLPVVATRNGGALEIVETLENGIAVDPRDHGQIADACLTLIRTPSLWERASRNGLDGLTAFSWETYARQSVDLYRDLAKGAAEGLVTQSCPLVVCDIDNTLTGCVHSAAKFASWVRRGRYPFVVATGRTLVEARSILRAWDLPTPAAYITSVGSEIYRTGPNGLMLWQAYSARLAADWDRPSVKNCLDALGVIWQPALDQNPAKLSLFGDAKEALRIEATLAAERLKARVIASHGRLIDVMPISAGKANAIAALAAEYGLGMEDCIACGDSGNDLDMLTLCGTAIVVGNATAELSHMAPRPGLLRVTRHHAAGVLQGLEQAGLVMSSP